MMKIKKTLTKIWPCVLAATLLTACSGGHAHSAAGGWEVNARAHWKVCECGESFDSLAHTLDDMSKCAVCGAEVCDYGDSVDVYTYSEYGDHVRIISYDADGSVISDLRYEYEYDAEGNKLSHQYYADGVLMDEAIYENGLPIRYTGYYEDGTKSVSEYDRDGNIVSSVYYDAGGGVFSTNEYEYAYTADGEAYEVKNTMTDFEGARYIGEYNERGDQIAWLCYDPQGTLVTEERYEYEYDGEDRVQRKKTYVGGMLTEEQIYVTVTDADGWMSYPGTVINYEADGAKTVTEYDEKGETTVTVYDANGSEIAAG